MSNIPSYTQQIAKEFLMREKAIALIAMYSAKKQTASVKESIRVATGHKDLATERLLDIVKTCFGQVSNMQQIERVGVDEKRDSTASLSRKLKSRFEMFAKKECENPESERVEVVNQAVVQTPVVQTILYTCTLQSQTTASITSDSSSNTIHHNSPEIHSSIDQEEILKWRSRLAYEMHVNERIRERLQYAERKVVHVEAEMEKRSVETWVDTFGGLNQTVGTLRRRVDEYAMEVFRLKDQIVSLTAANEVLSGAADEEMVDAVSRMTTRIRQLEKYIDMSSSPLRCVKFE